MSDKPHLVVLHGHLAEIKCHVHWYHNIPAERWHYNNDPLCPTFSPSVREFLPLRRLRAGMAIYRPR